jgi:hypothetical protein
MVSYQEEQEIIVDPALLRVHQNSLFLPSPIITGYFAVQFSLEIRQYTQQLELRYMAEIQFFLLLS